MPPSPSEIMERVLLNEGKIGEINRTLAFGQQEFKRIGDTFENFRDEIKTASIKLEEKFDKFQAWVRGLVLTVGGALILFLANQLMEILKKGG